MPVAMKQENLTYSKFGQVGEGLDDQPRPTTRFGKGKKSFLKKAKKFGKQGKLGRGYQIDSETFSYFVRILEILRSEEFESEEDKDAFVDNSLSLAEGHEVDFCSNQMVSRVIENILPMSSEERIAGFCEAFTPSLRVIVADPFASHVLEKLLEITSSDKWRSSKRLTEWFEKTAMFVLNNFEDFTFDKYASFVTKKVLECLSGHVERPSLEKSVSVLKKDVEPQVNLYGQREVNPKWEKMLQDFSKRFAAWPQFNDLGYRTESTRLLQNVIETVNKTQNSRDIIKDLVLRVLAMLPEELQPNDRAHRTLEVCLGVVDEKQYGLIFEKIYKGHLQDYCSLAGGDFTLKKLIACAPNEEYFATILEELKPSIESMFQKKNIGILNCLIVGALKYEAKQKELYKSLKDAVSSCGSNDKLIMTLLTMMTNSPKKDGELAEEKKDVGDKTDSVTLKFSFLGSTAVQALMDFKHSLETLQQIYQLDSVTLQKICLDPKASHIISKYFKNWNVPQKFKQNLLMRLNDFLVELAQAKFGSRIIDVVWLWAPLERKTTIAETLSTRIPLLAANKYGRFLVENLGLNAFQRNKKEWLEHIVSEDKRKKDALAVVAELGLETGTGDKGKKRKSEVNYEDVPATSELDSTIPNADTPKKKKKKNKNKKDSEPMETSGLGEEFNDSNATLGDGEIIPKKKKKNRKSGMDASLNAEENAEATPVVKKKKQKRQSTAIEEDNLLQTEDGESQELETPKKKKKKQRKSEAEDVQPESFPIADLSQTETPKNKKKKQRKSEGEDVQPESLCIADVSQTETPSKKEKKKNRKSKQF